MCVSVCVCDKIRLKSSQYQDMHQRNDKFLNKWHWEKLTYTVLNQPSTFYHILKLTPNVSMILRHYIGNCWTNMPKAHVTKADTEKWDLKSDCKEDS